MRVSFLICCAANSPLPAMRDVPTQTRTFILPSRWFLIQSTSFFLSETNLLVGFLHHTFRRLLAFRRLLTLGSGDMFDFDRIRGFLEALTKCTHHTSNALENFPKHPISFNIRG